MTRQQYRAARRLIRANGDSALEWLLNEQAEVFQRLDDQQTDMLRVRAVLEPTRTLTRMVLWPVGARAAVRALEIFGRWLTTKQPALR
jgi:hypothetical protein